jgi:DNA-binding NarL/FixJ family response regulator
MAEKKRIIIVDDHPLFREGIKSIISYSPQFEVVGEAGNGTEGLRLVKKLKPEIVIIDLSLPDKSGTRLASEIHKILPESKILVISMHSKIQYIAEAFQSGASGYIVKESAAERILEGLNIISQGGLFLDSSISPQVIKKLMGQSTKETKVTDMGYNTLTPREQEVMRLLAEGMSKKEIAKMLFISVKTVENHRSSIMKKLSLHNSLELVKYAAKLGLINLDLWKD